MAAVKELCEEKGIESDASDDPAVFTTRNLAKYRAVVFSNSNNEAFSDHSQSKAFTVLVADRNHPATAKLPAEWKWKDEGYLCDLVPDLQVLLEMNTTSVAKPPRETWAMKFEGNRFPLAWCHQVGKGRCFYTALGHDKSCYADPAFRGRIQGGILWVLGKSE